MSILLRDLPRYAVASRPEEPAALLHASIAFGFRVLAVTTRAFVPVDQTMGLHAPGPCVAARRRASTYRPTLRPLAWLGERPGAWKASGAFPRDMGRVLGMEDRSTSKRPSPHSFRVPAAQDPAFWAVIRASGKSTSAVIVAAVLKFGQGGGGSDGAHRRKKAAEFLGLAQKITDKFRALSAKLDDPYGILLLEECRDILLEIRACLLALLGARS